MGRNTTAYMREYQRQKYAILRAEALAMLGGKCAECGSTDCLEIDHRDRSQKLYELNQLVFRKRETFLAEMAKCQLLCNQCHNRKTVADRGRKMATGTHGTLSAYRYCRCPECRAAKAEWQKAYKVKIRERGRVGLCP